MPGPVRGGDTLIARAGTRTAPAPAPTRGVSARDRLRRAAGTLAIGGAGAGLGGLTADQLMAQTQPEAGRAVYASAKEAMSKLATLSFISV